MILKPLILGATAVVALAMPAAVQAGEVAGGVIGCDASGNKQIAGAVIGGVLGGVIGNNVVRKDQQAGTIIGATAGAATGSYVGCQMQKSDARSPAPSTTTTRRTQPAYVDDRSPIYADEPRRTYERRPAYVEEERRYDRRYYERDRPSYAVSEPGRKRHPHGMPPGQAKKLYGVGERMPTAYINDRQYIIYEPARYRLRTPPAGYRWVLYGEDAYLVRTETGLVSEVIRALLG
ncbi:RcnB family protein [Phenylobacterium sp.]|uniref:RcnB family protein n=1 Tax=Phenylobacterium sp. TaxID=1871053 RepID=UPI002ED95FED